jgi:hypothetical protein
MTNHAAFSDLMPLPHLYGSINNFLPKGRGNCIQRAVAMVMDLPTSKLVIGTLTTDHAFLHAWVDVRGSWFDPSDYERDGNRIIAHDPEVFRSEQNVIASTIVSRSTVMTFAKRGKLSRWMTSQDDTHHALDGVMGHVLLDELGISYRVDEQGFLFPV